MATTTATGKMHGLKKKPTQARSRARVTGILQAASALLGEVGYDGLSTNLIAARAKVPVGSIYQFFDSKDDVVAALVDQFRNRVIDFANEQLDAASLARNRSSFIATLINGIAAIQAESSAFVCLFSPSQSNENLENLSRELRRALAVHLDRVFGEAFPRLAVADRRRMLAAWADLTGVMIANLDRSKRSERAALIDELQIILSAYLDAKLARIK